MERLRGCVKSRLRALESVFPVSVGAEQGSTKGPNCPIPKPAEVGEEEGCKTACDPIKLFIKDEPHNLKKAAEGRFRLIHSLSLVDQMVDRILFYPWYAVELKNVMKTTQKTGWSPIPGGYQALVEIFPEDESIAVDKSLWDWTMPEWVIAAYVEMKKNQCVGATDEYWRLVWARLACVVGPRSYFELPSGIRYRQTGWGIMKSGWLLTLSMNSAAQAFQHVLAWRRMGKSEKPPHVWAMGDDILARMKIDDDDLERYWRSLETTGCLVKKIERRREFCGFHFVGKEGVTPLYPDKHRFILKYIEPKVEKETLMSYSLLYALSSDRWIDGIGMSFPAVLNPVAKLWAKGLVCLNVLTSIPDWVDY
nr:hypothetical protein 2 [Hypera postica associated sobemovirus 2]